MGRHGEQVAVYASHEELGRWRAAAAKAGVSLSTWIRGRCERAADLKTLERHERPVSGPKELTYARDDE